MATIVNTHEAKTHLSELIRRALAGEEIVIARAGKPAVRLVAVGEDNAGGRPFGSGKGKFAMTEKFFDPLPPELFEGPIDTEVKQAS
jgi:prevent-host-death family protein